MIFHPLPDVLFFVRYASALDGKSFLNPGVRFQALDRTDGIGKAASLMCDKDVDSLTGKVVRIQERIDGHGQITPPVGEDKIDVVIILNCLFIGFQRRPDRLALLLLCLIDRLFVADRIGILCLDFHGFAARFLRDPGSHLTGIAHKAILIDPDTCTGIRINVRGEIRVAHSAEIDDQSIAPGGAFLCCRGIRSIRSGHISRSCFSSTFLPCAGLRSLRRLFVCFLFCCFRSIRCSFLGSRRILSAHSRLVSTGREPEKQDCQ